MDMNINSVLVMDILAALTMHAWLKSHEPLPFALVVVALIIIPSISTCFLHKTILSFVSSLTWVYLVFYLTLISSVSAYRLSPYHPLATYPGPMILRLTKLWGAWIAYTGKSHIYLKELHDRYGPTVRIGPNELSTIDKGIIAQVLGNQDMPKGHLWDGRRFGHTGNSNGYDSIVDVRDSVLHSQLRMPWNKAFAAEPLKDYEELLIRRIIQLNNRLKEVCSAGEDEIGRVDMAKWISYFSYDFMGDLAFAGNFQLMQHGDNEGRLKTMGNAMYLVSITQHVPWVATFIRSLPFINREVQNFIGYGIEQAIKRSSMEMKRKDLFYHMGEASGSSGSDLPLIITNVLLAIVAGSDTVASVLSNAIYLLISHPGKYKKLQRELDEAFKEHGIDMDTQISIDEGAMSKTYGDLLGGLGYLNAVVNETMRLFPAVPTGLQRAPANGTSSKILQSGKTTIFLPEGNAITVPPYALHRDPRYFSPLPDAFIPERWLSPTTPSSSSSPSRTEYTTSRDAFIPFSVGPQNCAGRSIALIELRYGLATLARNFDMEFDMPKYNPMRWEKELEDRFTLSKGPLEIRMTWRGNGESPDGQETPI